MRLFACTFCKNDLVQILPAVTVEMQFTEKGLGIKIESVFKLGGNILGGGNSICFELMWLKFTFWTLNVICSAFFRVYVSFSSPPTKKIMYDLEEILKFKKLFFKNKRSFEQFFICIWWCKKESSCPFLNLRVLCYT